MNLPESMCEKVLRILPDFVQDILTFVATEHTVHVALSDRGGNGLADDYDDEEDNSETVTRDRTVVTRRRCVLATLVEAGYITTLQDSGNTSTVLMKMAECTLDLRVASPVCRLAVDTAKLPLPYCFRLVRDRHMIWNTIHILSLSFESFVKRQSWRVPVPAWRARPDIKRRALTVLPELREAARLFLDTKDEATDDTTSASEDSESERGTSAVKEVTSTYRVRSREDCGSR